MTKLLTTLVFFIFFSFASYSQFTNAQKISVGIGWRPELFELSNYSTRTIPAKGYISNIGRMDNPNLVVELSQKLNHERWLIQLSNYFSYNFLATPIDSLNMLEKDLKSFKYDFFIDVNYEIRFRKFKHSFIYVGAGIGRMNISKKFNYNYPTGELDNNGNRVFIPRTTSLSFWAPRISVGFAFKNISSFVTAHGTPDGNFDSHPSLWVEYKILYSFQLKKKKRKVN
jgi:hypothetical protein